MENFIFLYVAALLLAGLFSTRLMKVFSLPNVTGYIITSILMGPFILASSSTASTSWGRIIL
jgi:Kef-type K+ transport system membrane component KefB